MGLWRPMSIAVEMVLGTFRSRDYSEVSVKTVSVSTTKTAVISYPTVVNNILILREPKWSNTPLLPSCESFNLILHFSM